MLVDSHCHLDFKDFAAEREAVIDRARAAGIGTMLTISARMADFPNVRAIAESHDDIWCSVGLHPHEASGDKLVDSAALVEFAAHPKVVGIGETGLDYFYEKAPRDTQRQSFEDHIVAARATALPIIIHARDADADMAEILRGAMKKQPFTGLLHCFTSSRQLAEVALDLGLSISISGIVTFKNAAELRDTVKHIPLDRLLVETDAPYLAPIPHRGKRNEPAFVAHTAQTVADLKGIPAAALADATTDNFFRLFRKAKRPDAAP